MIAQVLRSRNPSIINADIVSMRNNLQKLTVKYIYKIIGDNCDIDIYAIANFNSFENAYVYISIFVLLSFFSPGFVVVIC